MSQVVPVRHEQRFVRNDPVARLNSYLPELHRLDVVDPQLELLLEGDDVLILEKLFLLILEQLDLKMPSERQSQVHFFLVWDQSSVPG